VTLTTATPSPPTVTPSAPHTSASPLPAYPSDYAAAIMTAWGGGDSGLLTLLTTSATAHQMLHDLAGTDQHWTRTNSDGAAGSSYVTYDNQDGDSLTLRTVNTETAAHHWHAGSVETWDPMTYPHDDIAYVRAFMNAWVSGNRTRMELLASQPITTHFLGLTRPDASFTVTEVAGSGAAGHIEVAIGDTASGLDAKLKVATAVVGASQAHGIEDCDPTCS
jgi:hypothetical protein